MRSSPQRRSYPGGHSARGAQVQPSASYTSGSAQAPEQAYGQSSAFTRPCPVYAYDPHGGGDTGSVEQPRQLPGELPAQPPRYCPTGQSAAQSSHAYPLPAAWEHSPVRYRPAAQLALSHARQDPSLS